MVQDLGGDRFKRSRLDPTGALADEVRRLRSELDVVKKMGRAPKGIGAHVYRSTTQSITSALWTEIAFNTQVFDIGDFWVSGSPGRFTVPTDGVYLAIAHAAFASNITGYRLIRMKVNGVQIARHNHGAADGGVQYLLVSKIRQLSAAQYITAEVYQTSGGALNINAGDNETFFSIWRLA